VGNGFVIPAAHRKMMSAFRRLRAHTLEYEKILQLSIKDMSANRRLILKIGFALKNINTLLTVLPLCKMGLAFQHRRNDAQKMRVFKLNFKSTLCSGTPRLRSDGSLDTEIWNKSLPYYSETAMCSEKRILN
jgi:hypothetical protein